MEILLLIIIVVALAIVCGALMYACYNLLKKVEVYEEWTEEFRRETENVYKRLKEVDDKNLFSPDDDVGFIFSELVRIMKEFDEKVK